MRAHNSCMLESHGIVVAVNVVHPVSAYRIDSRQERHLAHILGIGGGREQKVSTHRPYSPRRLRNMGSHVIAS